MPQGIYVSGAVAGVLGGIAISYHLYKNKYNSSNIPEQWKKIGTLKDLLVYPIKSCAPIILNNVECSALGLQKNWTRDRFLMVTDENYHFLTARNYPEMLRVHSSFNKSILTLSHPEMEPVRINLEEVMELQKPKKGDVWGTQVPVLDCGWAACDWFTRLLGNSEKTIKLVIYAAKKSRKLNHHLEKIYNFGNEDRGVFSDDTTYNLINQASVDDLNKKIENAEITYRNFRPNFVVTGAKPYEEDSWNFIKIGDAVFEIIMPCFRCVLTTLDPETGARSPASEPLETLKSYRLPDDPDLRKAVGNSPRMGVQMALRSAPGAIIKLNDNVYVA
ncbi:unnamed protein product [Leptosia nina]|uniref:MOSC domain-containing protein n=1 Tax=Leptosia nina TaxID=320188 RepID=A0AAV1JU30_9NEOP